MQCLEFAVQLGRHYEKLKSQGVEVLVVGGGPATRARAMAQHSRAPYTVLADPDRSVYGRYNLSKKMVLIQQSGTFLIDRDGIIRHIKRFTNPQAWIKRSELADVLDAVATLEPPASLPAAQAG